MHRLGDILDALFSDIVKSKRQPVTYVVADRTRDADAAWLGQSLQSRRDVDAVAIDVVTIGYHIAKINSGAEGDALVFGCRCVTVDHCSLDLCGAADRIDNARKFHQHAVAGVLYNATTVFRDLRINQLAKMSFEAFVRAFLIRPISRE